MLDFGGIAGVVAISGASAGLVLRNLRVRGLAAAPSIAVSGIQDLLLPLWPSVTSGPGSTVSRRPEQCYANCRVRLAKLSSSFSATADCIALCRADSNPLLRSLRKRRRSTGVHGATSRAARVPYIRHTVMSCHFSPSHTVLVCRHFCRLHPAVALCIQRDPAATNPTSFWGGWQAVHAHLYWRRLVTERLPDRVVPWVLPVSRHDHPPRAGHSGQCGIDVPPANKLQRRLRSVSRAATTARATQRWCSCGGGHTRLPQHHCNELLCVQHQQLRPFYRVSTGTSVCGLLQDTSRQWLQAVASSANVMHSGVLHINLHSTQLKLSCRVYSGQPVHPINVHDESAKVQSRWTPTAGVAVVVVEQGAAWLLLLYNHAPAVLWLGPRRSITVTSNQSQFTCSEAIPSRGGVNSLNSFTNWAIAIMVLGVMSFVLALVVASVAACKLRGAHKRHAVGGLRDLLPVTTPKVRTRLWCRRM